MHVLIAAAIPALVSGNQATEHAEVAGDSMLTILDPLAINDEVPLTLEQDGGGLTGTARDSVVAGTVDSRRIRMSCEVDTFQVRPHHAGVHGRSRGERRDHARRRRLRPLRRRNLARIAQVKIGRAHV